MRTVIILAVLLLIMVLVGWITISKSSDRSSINVETQRIEQDAERIMDSGSELLREAGSAVDQNTNGEAERAEELDTPAPPLNSPTQ